jgi:branched-subunit amino acid transport protein
MSAWIAVIAVGVGSLVFRIVPLAFADRLIGMTGVDRVLRHAGTAAVAAMAASSLDRAAVTSHVPALIVATAVGLVLTLRGKSMLTVVAVGLALYLVIADGLDFLL